MMMRFGFVGSNMLANRHWQGIKKPRPWEVNLTDTAPQLMTRRSYRVVGAED
jgi:hypothetical protein